jgi:hypothetical protein
MCHNSERRGSVVGCSERGEVANPHITTIRKLAGALGVDPAERVEDA